MRIVLAQYAINAQYLLALLAERVQLLIMERTGLLLRILPGHARRQLVAASHGQVVGLLFDVEEC